MRSFAGKLVHGRSPIAVLWLSSLLSALGLTALSYATSAAGAYAAATVWGIGVCFFWPTMLGVASEQFPKGGALVLGLMGTAGNLAISGAKAFNALHSTVESETAAGAKAAVLYSRVLPPGQTQVTAMQSEQPTFVSVELAANEVLPASTGRFSATTPYANWQPVYDSILTAVQSTGAGAVLVGLPNDAATR